MQRFFADAPNVMSEQDQTTTSGILSLSLYDKCFGSLTSPPLIMVKDTGDGAYALSSLTEKS